MNSTLSPALRQLETATVRFRDRLAREHRRTWVSEQRRASEALDAWSPELFPGERQAVFDGRTGEVTAELYDTSTVSEVMTDALSVAKWHHGRDNGQKYRFRKLAHCGTRMMIAQCKACDSERKPVPEGCGIARLCSRCSLLHAKRRRARFGRARQRASHLLQMIGYTRRKKTRQSAPGGVWSDKMITLTVPHFLLCHVEPGAEILQFGKGATIDATMARIYAVRAAWPLFARDLRKWFKLGGTLEKPRKHDVRRRPIAMPLKDGTSAPPPMHRAFEWTPGGDGLGHPHFHLWTLAPFIPATTIQSMWRDALIAVGVPLERDAHVQCRIQAFRDFNGAAVGELVKAGTRKALEWSRLYKHGPKSAFEYADGWTIAKALEEADPIVVASLYMALEGARLTQASRGFFEADEPAACSSCKAQGCWHVRFEAPPPPAETAPTTHNHERGPPP